MPQPTPRAIAERATRERDPEPPAAPRGAAPRLAARAAELLAARIADGALRPGALLFESHLAETLGTSRGPARQALIALAARGLVTRAEGRGWRVAGAASAEAGHPEDALAGLAGERLAPSASWARLYGEVERAIVSRTAFSAWRINETELARHYAVSRTVAREVIARLHQQGLLRREERARWIAPALTAAHVGELYALRALLEPAALTLAAPRLAPGFVTGLRARLEAAMARAEELGGPDLDRLEKDLHGDLLGHCPNATLRAAVRQHQSLLAAHSFLYAWAPRLFPAEPFLPEHHAVLAALESGKVEEAAAALAAHLRVSLGRAMARIEAVKRAPEPPALAWLRPVGRMG
ncbi:MAG: GntR family transcriptional regulator [Acetobacteraceae bacterium]|nr:GntR family transcriptional regulator [Acetobacteraceae bacterium]